MPHVRNIKNDTFVIKNMININMLQLLNDIHMQQSCRTGTWMTHIISHPKNDSKIIFNI